MKTKTAKQRGEYKSLIQQALFSNNDLVEFITGNDDTAPLSAIDKAHLLSKNVKSHLFIDGTLSDIGMYIFFDLITRNVSAQIKDCTIVLYAICHRDALDEHHKDGYSGNSADILSTLIEETLCGNSDLGIGKISLDSTEIYNAQDYYGCIMTFKVPDFS